MDKDRVEGAGNKLAGTVKEMTGDAGLQSKGATEKAVATAQNAAGGAKDSIRSRR